MELFDDMMDKVNWQEAERKPDPDSNGMLYATHEGVMQFGSIAIRVYRLNNGAAVFNAHPPHSAPSQSRPLIGQSARYAGR